MSGTFDLKMKNCEAPNNSSVELSQRTNSQQSEQRLIKKNGARANSSLGITSGSTYNDPPFPMSPEILVN